MNEQEYNDLYDCIETDYEYILLKYSKKIRNPAIFFGILQDIVIRHMMRCAPDKNSIIDILDIIFENIEENKDESEGT